MTQMPNLGKAGYAASIEELLPYSIVYLKRFMHKELKKSRSSMPGRKRNESRNTYKVYDRFHKRFYRW